jgi:co-chaperonin GroES (HSP10)
MDLTKVRPVNGNVIVMDDPIEEKSSGGIFLPENRTGDSVITGTVISVSDRLDKEGNIIPSEIKENDKVIYKFTAGAGNSWKSNGSVWRAVNHEELLAIVS